MDGKNVLKIVFRRPPYKGGRRVYIGRPVMVSWWEGREMLYCTSQKTGAGSSMSEDLPSKTS